MTTLREQLDHQMNLKNDAVDSYQRMKDQRDDLLEALKAVLPVLDFQNSTTIERGSVCWRRIEAAIAKAEGR